MTTTPTTFTVDAAGARIYYEVRGTGQLLLLVGAPMESDFFTPLADELAAEFTVVTSDPRGIARSTLDDPEQESTPEVRADDIASIVDALGGGPVDLFGSSGGAITGIALVARRPGLVRTLVAHEPPLLAMLPDAAEQRAAIDDVYETYRRDGQGAAWVKFFAASGLDVGGEADSDLQQMPEPSPQQEANGAYMLGHMLRPTTRYRPDVAALQAASTRIVVGIGRTSAGQSPYRAAVAFAEAVGSPVVEFPGSHDGFLEEPPEFADVLRRVLGRG